MLRLLPIFMLTTATSLWAVGVGDTKAEVLAELGRPNATMTAGNREFLTYAGGRVELTDGKVTGFRGQPKGRAAKPDAASPEPEGRDPEVITTPYARGHWFANFEEAMEEAENTDKRILALFTGSDWCPPCQKFEAEVAHDEQFAKVFSPYFVFYKCDWLRNTPQPPAVAAEVERMRREYDIEQYPTLKVLDSQGEELDEVDWTSVRGNSFKGIMMQAIDDSRVATTGGKKASPGWWPF